MADGDVLFEWDGGTLPDTEGTAPTVDDEFMVFSAETDYAFARWFVGAQAVTHTMRWYYLYRDLAGTSWTMGSSQNSNATMAAAKVSGAGSAGEVRFNDIDGEIARSSTGLLVDDTMYRFEMQVDQAAGTFRGAVFEELSTVPLYDTGELTANLGVEAPGQMKAGRVTAMAVAESVQIGRVKTIEGVGSWVGPHPSDIPPSVTGVEMLGIWNGFTIEGAELLGAHNG